MANNVPDNRPPSKGERLTVRFDEVEIERVRRRSLAMGVVPSVLVRAAALDAVDREDVRTTDASASGAFHDLPAGAIDEIRRLRTELNRVGVNFNQLVRRVHTDGVDAGLNDEATQLLLQLLPIHLELAEMLGGVRR